MNAAFDRPPQRGDVFRERLRNERTALTEGASVFEAARTLALAEDLRQLPLPGSGATQARFEMLLQIGRCDLALARVLEAHLDAMAILAEAHRTNSRTELYGVWAARHPTQPLRAERVSEGWRLQGKVPFCTGAREVDGALIAAEGDGGRLLFDVAATEFRGPGQYLDDSVWRTAAMSRAPAATLAIDFVVPPTALVGVTGFYLERRGFWPGAAGVAACWLGGAMGLLDTWLARGTRATQDAHAFAHLGGAFAVLDGALQSLREAATLADDVQADTAVLQIAAQVTRHQAERACTDVMDRMGRALGPRLLVGDADTALRAADLSIYIRQCHAERDLEALGRQLFSDFARVVARPGFQSWQ